MKLKRARGITGGLSQTSKMPCSSYSLPAIRCKTGSKLHVKDNTVCSQCYARKGMYRFGRVQKAQQKRLDSLNDPLWVEAMAALLANQRFFRWHDSGDIQSVKHLHNIVAVCEETPYTTHWLPTKEVSLVKAYIKKYGITDNLIIRLSAPMIDSKRLKQPNHDQVKTCRSLSKDGITNETLVNTSHICPASQNDGECGDCRACWLTNVEDVIYPMH